MVMGHLKPVGMMDAVVPVELVLLGKNVVGEPVCALQTVPVEIAGMMGAEEPLVEYALHLKLVSTVSVLELRW